MSIICGCGVEQWTKGCRCYYALNDNGIDELAEQCPPHYESLKERAKEMIRNE